MRRSAGGSFERVGISLTNVLLKKSQCAGAREGRSNENNRLWAVERYKGLNAPERGRVVRTLRMGLICDK